MPTFPTAPIPLPAVPLSWRLFPRALTAAASLATALLAGAPAMAADQATLHETLFSPDGRYFGFIEYGQWDTSGHPYGAFVLIDTEADAWVPGTPIRLEIEDDTLERVDGLKAVQRKAAPLVRRYALAPSGRVAGRFDNPDQPRGAAQSMSAHVPGIGSLEVALRQKRAVAAHGCNEDWNEPMDFELTVAVDGARRVIAPYAGRLPRSRGCAHGYGISRVVVHTGGPRAVVAVVLDVYTPGWEWYDRRHMAVTARLR